MMKNLLEVLQILVSYTGDGEYANLASYPQEISLAGPPPSEMSQEHRDRLEELNTCYDDEQECWSFVT